MERKNTLHQPQNELSQIYYAYLEIYGTLLLVYASLPQKGSKMRGYFGGLDYGQHYLSESSATICVASGRARGLHSAPRFQVHNHRSAVR